MINRRTIKKSAPIMNGIYEVPILVEWNENQIGIQVDALVDSVISKLESSDPKYSLMKSYGYGVMNINDEIKESISFSFLKNPRRTENSDDTVLTLSYKNILRLESKVSRGDFNVDTQNDNVNVWLCFPASVSSLEEAKKSKEFANNIIDLLKNVFKPSFKEWALKKLKESWMNSGLDPRKTE